jgi:CRP/FNR family transcriptional regulator, cyclic AMP receptor protein
MSFRIISQFQKGETLFKESTEGQQIFKIITGQVLICKLGPGNKQIPLAKLGAGEMFGEMYLFEDNRLRNASAVVLENSTTLEIYPPEALLEILAPLTPITLTIFETLSERLLKTSGKFVELLPEKAVVNAKPAIKAGEYTGQDKLG